MANSWGVVSRQRLMETVVILWALTEVPGDSITQRPVRQPPRTQGTRQLTFEREKGLVETFAFLSGTTDDPSKVMAVCVEEGSAGDSLTIRLASNSDDCSDVLSGFRRIAMILEHSSRREGRSEFLRHELLREIVRLDCWRILSRLRSKHAKASRKTSGRCPLILQLSETVEKPLRRKGKKLPAENVEALKIKMRDILTLFNLLEEIPKDYHDLSSVQNVLLDLVKHFSELADDETLSDLLEKVIDLDLALKNHLNSAVGKLGRYHSASRDLIRAARTERYSIFNKILVDQQNLPPPPASHLLGSTSTLEGSVNDLINRERVLHGRSGRRLSFRVRDYLGKLYLSKSESFKTRTSNSSGSWKVHAEIKLLFFYELYKADLPPRVICASKSPCYLCHTYFDSHGQYQVPETHGRLYPGWILPTWLENLTDQERAEIGRVTDTLHDRLVLRIQQLVMKERVAFTYPNESVLWPTTNWSASSLTSTSPEKDPQKSIVSDKQAQDLELIREFPEEYRIFGKHQGSSSSSSTQVQPLASAADASALVSDPSEFREFREFSAPMVLQLLNPGETANLKLANSAIKLQIATKRLNLRFSRERFCENGDPESCWVRCELLDSSQLPQAMSPQPLDIMSIAPGSEVTLEAGSVYATRDLRILAGEDILSIRYSAEEMVGT